MSVTIIGEAFVDIIFPRTRLEPGITRFVEMSIRVGGNAFIATQVAKMGEKAKFLGKLGEDPFGNYIRNSLKENNVVDLITTDTHKRTGLCISITYENGERILIADRGANDELSTEDLLHFWDNIIDSRILYFSGYTLLNEKFRKDILEIIQKIRKENKECEIFFNPGAPNIINSDIKKIIKNCTDVVILNLQEAENLAGSKEQNKIIKKLEKIAKTVVITKGEQGCILITAENKLEIPTQKIKIRDTTGAGDAFSAGFIVGKLRGLSLVDCAKLANKVALNFLKERYLKRDNY